MEFISTNQMANSTDANRRAVSESDLILYSLSLSKLMIITVVIQKLRYQKIFVFETTNLSASQALKVSWKYVCSLQS